MKKFYKIVTSDLKSICSTHGVANTFIQYHPDEWTYPTLVGSALYVFESKRNVNYFLWLYKYRNVRVYEVEVCGIMRVAPFVNPTRYDFIDRLNTVLTKKKNRKKFTHLTSPTSMPSGTVCVTGVKLIKEVEDLYPE
jgi:hypothetical protein